MENEIFKMAVNQGIWAALFVVLLFKVKEGIAENTNNTTVVKDKAIQNTSIAQTE
ncbi:BhlA/UviB family holin-like peptide [Clostridium kluyveri]|nr:BhlA/UviB family holin-like peptide [Clostridium kluyveri]UZQ52037.1 BhlA/UviB family holin-like peptide [Clostridium kluyveri]